MSAPIPPAVLDRFTRLKRMLADARALQQGAVPERDHPLHQEQKARTALQMAADGLWNGGPPIEIRDGEAYRPTLREHRGQTPAGSQVKTYSHELQREPRLDAPAARLTEARERLAEARARHAGAGGRAARPTAAVEGARTAPRLAGAGVVRRKALGSPKSAAEDLVEPAARREELRERRALVEASPRPFGEAEPDLDRIVEGAAARFEPSLAGVAADPRGFGDALHDPTYRSAPGDGVPPFAVLAAVAPGLARPAPARHPRPPTRADARRRAGDRAGAAGPCDRRGRAPGGRGVVGRGRRRDRPGPAGGSGRGAAGARARRRPRWPTTYAPKRAAS